MPSPGSPKRRWWISRNRGVAPGGESVPRVPVPGPVRPCAPPTRSDNEERSAELAQRELESSGGDPQAARHVHELVLATRHDALPRTQDEKVIVDIDLAILGAGDLRFAEYERQVREEYAFVPGWLFGRKRRAILQSFLERDSIYSTPYFIETLEARARANLRRALGEHA